MSTTVLEALQNSFEIKRGIHPPDFDKVIEDFNAQLPIEYAKIAIEIMWEHHTQYF